MSHSTNAELVHCDRCSAETTRTRDGDCTVCRARDAGRRARQERREAEAHDRARLGLHPSTRGLALVRISVDAALHWCRVSARAGAPLPDVVLFHLERARQELGR